MNLFLEFQTQLFTELGAFTTPEQPKVKTKIGEASGATLYSIDNNVWYASEEKAREVYANKQAIINSKLDKLAGVK